MTIVYLLLFLSCLIRSALSDGWVLVIVCRDQYTVWTSSSPGELMAAANAAIEPWDQYIRPIEDAEEETLPCVCASKCINVCLRISLRVVSISTSLCVFLCVWISATVYVCVFRVRITGQDSDTDKSRTLTSPNAHFPSSASSKQRRQIITSLFFCLLSLYSFYSVYPKCCCGSMRD